MATLPPTTGLTTGTTVVDSLATQTGNAVTLDTALLKPASRCNIDCTYCYVYHMADDGWARLPKAMSVATMEATAEALGEVAGSQASPFGTVLHGGEPLLIGAKRFLQLTQALRATLSPDYPISMQTNGMLLTERVLDICSEYRISVAVSIDGPRGLNDAFRLDHQGRSTFDRVMAGMARLRRHRDAEFLDNGCLAVIDIRWPPRQVYEFFQRIKAPSVDFLYRDGNHANLPPGKASLDSVEHGKWMLELAELYLQEQEPVPIRILDDMLRVFLGGGATKEGLGATAYGIVIIDTDGAIRKNDTLKSASRGADQFASAWNVHRDSLAQVLRTPEFKAYHEAQMPNSEQCKRCPHLAVCGGGMLTHRWSESNGYDNPSVYCADQIHLIEGLQGLLQEHGCGMPEPV